MIARQTNTISSYCSYYTEKVSMNVANRLSDDAQTSTTAYIFIIYFEKCSNNNPDKISMLSAHNNIQLQNQK